MENSHSKSPIESKRNSDLFFNTRNNLKIDLIPNSESLISSINKMGVYNDLAKKLKSNKNIYSEINSRDHSNNISRKNSPDFKKVKSYNQSFTNFENIMTSGNSTFANFNKSKSRITSAGGISKKQDLSKSSWNIKNNSNKISSNEIEGPEELHYFNVILSQNNKNLAYKFEHFEPIEDYI